VLIFAAFPSLSLHAVAPDISTSARLGAIALTRNEIAHSEAAFRGLLRHRDLRQLTDSQANQNSSKSSI